jgi:serine/threonine protein kinase
MNIQPSAPKPNAGGAAQNDKGGFRIKNMLSSMKRTLLEAGATVGKYRIISEIDRGGMAVVYKAMQLDLKREVALKVMPANITINHQFVERFLSEAHSVAKLSHPCIVNIYETAAENNVYYLAMELIKGPNLFRHLHENKPKVVDVLEIVSRLAEALSYAHGQKIIHRDLKLNNVIMKDPLFPVVIDFGLAKAVEEIDSGITRAGEIMGSPSYMAPERLLGGMVDQRSDICSLGIMLYEMLTFKNPYLDQRNLHQTTLNVMEANPVPPKKLVPWLPDEIEAVTLKAMAKDPNARYQTMEEFRDDIKRYQRGDIVSAKPPTLRKRTKRFVRKKWAPIAISALVIISCTVFAANHYIQSKKVGSRWQLVHSEFPEESDKWVFGGAERGTWRKYKRSVHGVSQGFSYARLEWRFNRDVLIELEVSGADNNLFNAGIFLFGNDPKSAYCFHLNRGGNGESGITFPGSDFLFQDIESGKIPWQSRNRVAIERLQNTISLSINGVLVARVYDFFPPLGKDHERMGFFVNGSDVRFSNLNAHRHSIPVAPSPALIADRFRQRGDFEGAIDEYKGLMVDQSALTRAKDLHLKIAECQIRLGQYSEALRTLSQSSHLQNSESVRGHSKFLSAMAHRKSGDTQKMHAAIEEIAREHELSPVNYHIMSNMLIHCGEKIKSGDIDGALADIKRYSALYPKFSKQWGNLYLQVLDAKVKLGNLEAVRKMSSEIAALYPQNSETFAHSRTLLAKAYLNVGQTKLATDIFNQRIHTQSITDNVWEAWFSLAEIYEYNFDYKNALSIYLKIYRESPPTSEIYQMAALKCAEYSADNATPITRNPILHEIVNGGHPFPLPRLIANYYLDKIDENRFRDNWLFFYPQDPWHRYYTAKKQMMNGQRNSAVHTLDRVRRELPQNSWRTFQVLKILRSPDAWQ